MNSPHILMKRFFTIFASLMAFVMVFSGCGKAQDTGSGSGRANPDYNFEDGKSLTGLHYVEMAVEGYGTIIMEIDADAAPISATNFLKLANSGFYDGLTFHRIISGFMAQGGDGSATDRAAEAETITGEFALNGYDNPISHTRGVVSMARAQDYNSASSQFFIMHADYTGLDGAYAAFGRVIEGMDVVDGMCKDADPNAYNGMLEKGDQPVISYVKLLGTEKP